MTGPSHWWCPACGWFGRRARKRARRADDTAHILWARQLANETRARRVGPDGLIAATDCRVLR